jgi:hypothetical protein
MAQSNLHAAGRDQGLSFFKFKSSTHSPGRSSGNGDAGGRRNNMVLGRLPIAGDIADEIDDDGHGTAGLQHAKMARKAHSAVKTNAITVRAAWFFIKIISEIQSTMRGGKRDIR